MIKNHWKLILNHSRTKKIAWMTFKKRFPQNFVPSIPFQTSETHGIPRKEHFSPRNNENRFESFFRNRISIATLVRNNFKSIHWQVSSRFQLLAKNEHIIMCQQSVRERGGGMETIVIYSTVSGVDNIIYNTICIQIVVSLQN